MAPFHRPVRASSRTREAMALGFGAALGAWGALLVALNLTGHPLMVGAAFIGLSWVTVRARMTRLLLVSVIAGLALLIVVPGVAVVDGSWGFIYANGAWSLPADGRGWAELVAGAVRIPAQILATVLLGLVPARLVLEGAGRISPRTALLGGLAARLRPLLLRDLRLVRDELESRGLRIGRDASLLQRARATGALWEATTSGLLDRAFGTAAALLTRGYRRAEPTMGALPDPTLDDGVRSSPTRDRALLAASLLLVVSVCVGRATGQLAAPSLQAFASDPEQATPCAVLAAVIALLLAAVAGRALPMSPLALEPQSRSSSSAPRLGSAAALCVETASMRYPSSATAALVDATLHVRPGEMVVLAGASGSGKSTLLDVITGVAPRTTGGQRTGTVRLGEHVLDGRRVDGAAHVAAVLQDPEAQVLVGIVAEEVAFGPRHAGLPIGEVARRVGTALDRLDIRHLALRDCASLSGGELQRVLLAAAIALEPALLVLDEPTSQIDATSERRFWEAVDDVRRDLGIAVVVAEHRLDRVMGRADRVILVDGGRIVADVPAHEAGRVAPQLFADAYAGLAPAPVAALAPPRLEFRFDHIDVGGPGGAHRTLLRGVSVALPPRSIVTLEGPNGAGKSTLLRSIRGLHRARGRVAVDGVARSSTGVGASVRQFGLLSQGAGALMPGRTVQLAAEDTCRRLGTDVAAAHVALQAAGLADRLDAHPSELSVGERQRLALVAATAHRPAVWLLDEPTRGMDTAARRWVACHVLAHAAAGGVVLVATHDPALAAAIATHRLRLDLRTGPSLLEVRRAGDGRIRPEPMATAVRGPATLDQGALA